MGVSMPPMFDSSFDPQPMTILSGYLRKKDDGQVWKHRWFELVPSERILRYFSAPEDEVPRAVVPLATIHDACLGPQSGLPAATRPTCLVLRVRRTELLPGSGSGNGNINGGVDGDRDGSGRVLVNFVLEALNEQEARLWLAGLNAHIKVMTTGQGGREAPRGGGRAWCCFDVC